MRICTLGFVGAYTPTIFVQPLTHYLTIPSSSPRLHSEDIHHWWNKYVGEPQWVAEKQFETRRRGIGSYSGRLENGFKKAASKVLDWDEL